MDLIERLRQLANLRREALTSDSPPMPHVHSEDVRALFSEAAAALEAAREDAERWRSYQAGGGEGASHVCVKCGHPYWPEGENEDCPRCGHDGSAIDQAREVQPAQPGGSE